VPGGTLETGILIWEKATERSKVKRRRVREERIMKNFKIIFLLIEILYSRSKNRGKYIKEFSKKRES